MRKILTTAGCIAFASASYANGTSLKCASELTDSISQYDTVLVSANPEGSWMDLFWTKRIYISPRAFNQIDREWQVYTSGQRIISRATQHELINAGVLVGSREDEQELRYLISGDYDTSDQFIQSVSDYFKHAPRQNIIEIYSLNRATLKLKRIYVGGGGVIVQDGSYICEINSFGDLVEHGKAIGSEYESIVIEHNSGIERLEPADGVGLPKKL